MLRPKQSYSVKDLLYFPRNAIYPSLGLRIGNLNFVYRDLLRTYPCRL